MAQGQLVINALIIPLSSSSAPPRPTQPPQPPTGGAPPRPDQGLPGPQPEPTPPEWMLPHPENPIYYPLPPNAPVDPSYGIPIDGPHPDQGLPGSQPHPDQGLPGPQPHPEHPIVLPPDNGGWLPVYIWGPTDPRPTPPIVIPPTVEVGGDKLKVHAMWTPENGWETIVILKPQAPTPTPSKRK